MDIKQLKYFLTIAEEGQITSAAKRLHMAQPPLSQQLKLLEDELGAKLLKRGSRHVELTDVGKLLRIRAKQIVELSDSTLNEIDDFIKGLNGTVKIGTVTSSGAAFLNKKMSKFHEKYSGIKFSIHEGNTFKIVDLLNKGVIDLGIVRTPFNALNFECRYMNSEPMIAVMTEKYNLDNTSSAISITELKDKPLIIYRRFEKLIYETCVNNGFKPNVFCKNDDARTTLLWASTGFGIGIVPKSTFLVINNKNLIYKEIKNSELVTRLALIWIKSRYISSLTKKFIDIFIDN